MANPEFTSSVPIAASPEKGENLTPISSKIAKLTESRSELLTRIQSLKQDLQSWRSKLGTQVTVYRNELSKLKKSLDVEVVQLRLDFQELRTTLQQQQEDVTASLKTLGLQDASPEVKDKEKTKIEGIEEELHASHVNEKGVEN